MARSTTALVLILAYAVFAFGWRSLLQWRRYGDTGLRLAPPPGLAPRAAHLSLVVAFVLAVLAPIAAMVARDPASPGGLHGLVDGGAGRVTWWLGLLAVAIGMVLTLVAQVQMGASWRVGVDAGEHTDLVTGGLFRHVRNPIFTSMLVGFAGLALLVPNALGIAGFVLSVLSLQLQVRLVEEPYLIERHGTPYRTWAASSGRFLPGLGRLR
jgi:protein-S-isoprenylcysteine O-methyltransferase Ste14